MDGFKRFTTIQNLVCWKSMICSKHRSFFTDGREGNSPNGCQFNEVVCIRYGGALSHSSANKQ